MHDRPDKAVLLDAVTRFLMEDIRPAIDDKALSFRVLIAANLTRMVSAELRDEETQNAAELGRLIDLLDAEAPSDRARSTLESETRALNRLLSQRVRADVLTDDEREAVTAHLRATLAEKLRIINPRFDLSEDIE